MACNPILVTTPAAMSANAESKAAKAAPAPARDELAPLAAILPNGNTSSNGNGNGNGNGAHAVSRIS
ncbi:MAG: hypothetical protein ABIR29_00320 [Chthoniobacterales bacterium]